MTKVISVPHGRLDAELSERARALLAAARPEVEAMIPEHLPDGVDREAVIVQNAAGGAIQALLKEAAGPEFAGEHIRLGALAVGLAATLGQSAHCEACLLREVSNFAAHVARLSLATMAGRDDAEADCNLDLSAMACAGAA